MTSLKGDGEEEGRCQREVVVGMIRDGLYGDGNDSPNFALFVALEYALPL
jgi:hypothetical protein